jgi:hypothetical protein
MRANGVRSLLIFCRNCHHEKIMNVDHLPGDLSLPSLGQHMACTKCGTIGADVQPNWMDRSEKASRASSGAINEPAKKQAPEPAAPGKQYRWAIYRLKGTPAALLGDVEAPDEETAIKRTIEKFGVTNPQLQKRLLARRRT